MEKYSFIYREEDLEELVCESSEMFLPIKRDSSLARYLRDKDNSGLSIVIDNESYAYDECFTVCVNVKNISKFHFVFKNKEFDLEQLKEDLIPLRDAEEPKNLAEKRAKLSNMFDVLTKYNPLFIFVPEYCSVLYKESINLPCPIIVTEQDSADEKQVNILVDVGATKEQEPKKIKEPKVKEPKAKKERAKFDWKIIWKELKDLDNLLIFFSACLMVVSGTFTLNLFANNNGIGTVFVILLAAYLGFETYIIYLRQKTLDEPKLIGKEFIPFYIFSILGLGVGVGVCAILGAFDKIKSETVGELWTYIGIGTGIALVLVIISIVLGFFLKAKIIKEK